jgi:hypothetical protein
LGRGRKERRKTEGKKNDEKEKQKKDEKVKEEMKKSRGGEEGRGLRKVEGRGEGKKILVD